MPALKVLQIHNREREERGEDTVVAREASPLLAAGSTGGGVSRHQSDCNIGGCADPAGGTVEPASGPRLRDAIREVNPEVAHVDNTWWALTPSYLRELDRLDVPTVAKLHNYRLMCVNAQLFRGGAPCEDGVGVITGTASGTGAIAEQFRH
jgi:hypothetical protein